MDFLSISASPFSTYPPLTITPKHHSPFLFLSSRKPSPETVAPPLPPPEKAPVPSISRRPINPINPVSGGTGGTARPSVASVNPLSSKLWLSAKLSPPPPPPPPLPKQDEVNQDAKPDEEVETEIAKPNPELRDKAKIFVGNLPFWVKKDEICRFFRQFGPLKKVELIKGHESPQRNVGYCFVIYGGPTAKESAMQAAKLDGVEFHGKQLTVKLDDWRRLRKKEEDRGI